MTPVRIASKHATTCRDPELASFSNRCGVAAPCCIAAPGVDVPVAYYGPEDSAEPYARGLAAPSRDRGRLPGASFAAPLVAGGLAVPRHRFRGLLGNRTLLERLYASADKQGPAAPDAVSGQGAGPAHLDTEGHFSACELSSTLGQGIMDLNAAARPQGGVRAALETRLGRDAGPPSRGAAPPPARRWKMRSRSVSRTGRSRCPTNWARRSGSISARSYSFPPHSASARGWTRCWPPKGRPPTGRSGASLKHQAAQSPYRTRRSGPHASGSGCTGRAAPTNGPVVMSRCGDGCRSDFPHPIDRSGSRPASGNPVLATGRVAAGRRMRAAHLDGRFIASSNPGARPAARRRSPARP